MHLFNTIQRSVWALFCLACFPLTSLADLGDGCIIVQTDGMACMQLDAGTVGQTFTPCREGLLDYLVLYTGSSDDVSFAAELRILRGDVEMHRQQVILQSADRQPKVRVRMARPPYLYPGETYTLELKVPGGKQLAVAYTENDRYSFGSMTLNGLLTPYDLTFEAGIRSFEESIPSIQPDNCNPEQFEIHGGYELAEVRRQGFHLCEDGELLGMSLGYRSPVAFSGRIQLMHHDKPYVPISVLPFTAEPSEEGRLIATAGTADVLKSGSYHFEVLVDGEAQSYVQLLTGVGNPYARGTLFTLDGPSTEDLSFSVITDEPMAPKVERAGFEVLSGYEDHPCTIAQPFHDSWQSFSGAKLSLDLPLCDDGKLQTLYLPARVTGVVSAIVYKVQDANGRTMYTANVMEDHFEEGRLALDLGGQQVVYYQRYTVEIDIPTSAKLELGMSTHPDHAGFVARSDDESIRFHPSLALGMEPFAFEEVTSSQSPPVNFNAYPNPFTTELNIELSEVEGREVVVRLYSVLGEEIAVEYTDGSRGEETLSFRLGEHMERGFYTLRIESGDYVSIDTVVKQ